MPLASISIPSILLGLGSWQMIVAVVAVLALMALVLTLKEKIQKYRTRGWPTTQGTIARIESRKVDGGINAVDYWKIAFDYEYAVTQRHTARYSFNCTSETMAQGAVLGLTDKPVNVHYKPSDETNALLWEDEIWDIWWDTYWNLKEQIEAAT